MASWRRWQTFYLLGSTLFLLFLSFSLLDSLLLLLLMSLSFSNITGSLLPLVPETAVQQKILSILCHLCLYIIIDYYYLTFVFLTRPRQSIICLLLQHPASLRMLCPS